MVHNTGRRGMIMTRTRKSIIRVYIITKLLHMGLATKAVEKYCIY